jgi:uncharacterized protein (DUF362 family)
MKKTSVAIIRGGIHPSTILESALELIDAERLITPEDRVLIKPNYVVAKHPSTGITTDSRILESVIEFVKGCGVKDIVVGEGGSGNTDKAFNVVGIREITSKQKVKLVNLNRDPRINIKISNALALKEVGVARTALESTCIINVPKLKIHHMAVVTLNMKNLMGLILPKNIMHGQLHEKIVDLSSVFKDKVKINVIDGLVAGEIDETSGNPVKMDLLIAGQDMVAVDTVGTAIMGIDPRKVKYLTIAGENGLGVSNLDEIQVLGERIEDVKKQFRI